MGRGNLTSVLRDAVDALSAIVRSEDPKEIDVPDLDQAVIALAGEPVAAVERQLSPPLIW